MPRTVIENPLWDAAELPNHGSRQATPASTRIDLHYRELNIWERWTWQRFIRLARFLSLTLEELASVVCIPHSSLPTFERENHVFLGRHPDRSAALLLTVLEAQVMKHLTKDVVENAMPDLNKI